MPSNDPVMNRNWFAFVPCPGCAPHSVSLQCTRLRDPRRSFVHVNRGKHPLRFALRQTNTKSTSRNECGNSHSGNREANDFYERFEAQSEATFSNAKPTERFKLSSFMEWSNDESDEDYVPQVQVFNECAESETDNVPKPSSGSEPVEEAIDAVSMMDPPSKPRKVLRQNHMPLVAIIGRPNVGKSMLVNRISGAFRTGAVVEDTPGVTRDRTYRVASWNRWQFRIVDTGGLVFDDRPGDVFLPQIRQQALIALREATVAVLVVDGQEGFTALDQEIASFLRKTCDEKGAFGRRIPILVAVNKCESHVQGEALAAEFWQLGLGQPMPVSGIHGSGVAELLDEICYYLPAPSEDSEKAVSLESNVRNVAIIGRPNVGKSSLLNALLGEERAIVSQVPGTTRDAIDELLVLRDERTGDEVGYMLIDTAGVRRKKNVEFGTEFFMINRAFKAIRRADVVLLVLDMEQGIMDQDAELAERIVDEGKACVLVGNKWDALGKKDNRIYNDLQRHVRDRLPMVDWANAIFVSAKTGQRIERILELVDAAAKEHARRVSTAVLNEVLLEAVQWQAPPTSRGGQSGKLYYCTQVAVKPPTIAFFVNNPQLFPDTYKRYLERKFREALGFRGTPIRMLWRERKRRARSALKGRSVS